MKYDVAENMVNATNTFTIHTFSEVSISSDATLEIVLPVSSWMTSTTKRRALVLTRLRPVLSS